MIRYKAKKSRRVSNNKSFDIPESSPPLRSQSNSLAARPPSSTASLEREDTRASPDLVYLPSDTSQTSTEAPVFTLNFDLAQRSISVDMQ